MTAICFLLSSPVAARAIEQTARERAVELCAGLLVRLELGKPFLLGVFLI